ncbi:hypothetical protein [Mycolicibacterium vulneris]|nr:hypothetical protein [Mycolicibacterium vulneris]
MAAPLSLAADELRDIHSRKLGVRSMIAVLIELLSAAANLPSAAGG